MVLSLPDAQSAEEHVRLALSGWKSAYCYTLTAASAAASPPFRFHVEWSRRPSPHEPLPTVRVHMTAAVDAEGGELSCRLEGEQTVHRAQLDGHSSLDSHILRLLKAKAEFVKRARLPLSAADSAFLSSRLHYASYTPPPLHTTSARDASHSRLIAALDREARGSQPPNAAAVAVAGSTQRGSSRGSSSSTARYTVRRRGWEEEEEEYGAESGSTTHLDGSQSAFEESAPSAGLDTPSAQQAPPASQLDGSAGGGWVGSLSSQSLAGNRAVSEQVTASTFDHASSHAGAAASGGGSGSGLSELLAYSVPSAAALEDRLVELFRQADVDGRSAHTASLPLRCSPSDARFADCSLAACCVRCAFCAVSGRLSVDEVSALLSSAAVGLSLGSTSLHSFVVELMSAYDENGDGQLVWAEWLPVAVDLIQTAAAAEWAKQASEKQQASYQRRVSERLAGKQQTQLTAEIASLAAELDPTGSGLLPPAQFQQLMHAISVQLHGHNHNSTIRPHARPPAGCCVRARPTHSMPRVLLLPAAESECEAVLAHMEKNGGQRATRRGSSCEQHRAAYMRPRPTQRASVRLPACRCVCCAAVCWYAVVARLRRRRGVAALPRPHAVSAERSRADVRVAGGLHAAGNEPAGALQSQRQRQHVTRTDSSQKTHCAARRRLQTLVDCAAPRRDIELPQ